VATKTLETQETKETLGLSLAHGDNRDPEGIMGVQGNREALGANQVLEAKVAPGTKWPIPNSTMVAATNLIETISAISL